MRALRKRKVFAGVLFIFFVGISYLGCSYLDMFSYDALAQSSSDSGKSVAIKIPPKISVSDDKSKIAHQKLQTSDIKILTSEGKNLIFRVELAQTENQKRIGLMFRSTITSGTGMLFLFNDVRERAFWMKNTWAPLDIIFIREDGVIHNIHYNAEPNSLERISSGGEVQHVLEIGGGEAMRQGISIGDRIFFD